MVNKIKLAALVIAIIGSGSAYAKEKPPIYNPKYSHALNMWIAGEMGNDINDQKIPKEQAVDFLDTNTGRALDAGVNIHNMKTAGVGSGAANALGAATFLLGAALDSDRQPVRNSFWYWHEEHGQTKAEAQLEFTNLMLNSIEKSLQEAGFVTSHLITPLMKGKIQFSAVFIYDKKEGQLCTNVYNEKDGSNCYVLVTIFPPKKAKYNYKGEEGSYWFFGSGDLVDYNNIKFTYLDKNNFKMDLSNNFVFDQVKVQSLITKNMGDGFFTYLAPKKSQISDNNLLNFPLILEKGESYYFVKVEE